jgi:aryl sulfotransferase
MGRPQTKYVYRNFLMDSTRWDRFVPRDGDVLVCTSYKAGTTWTQMICALLIHQTPDLPAPLAKLSPWLDMLLSPLDEVVANYESQPHRRFIKTHTPFDALPYYDNVTYLYCGRDPRDVFLSMQNHMANLNFPQLAKLLTEQGHEVQPPPPVPEDLNDRFRLWLTQGSFDWEGDGFPFWSHFRHAQSFWDGRDLPNVHFLHYADLSADLEGQMRRVAGILGIEIDEARWPGLVKAASFAEMKANADKTAPNTDHAIWNANSDFFRTGRSQWQGALSEESLRLYEDVKAARFPQDFVYWLENGSAAVGEPKTL